MSSASSFIGAASVTESIIVCTETLMYIFDAWFCTACGNHMAENVQNSWGRFRISDICVDFGTSEYLISVLTWCQLHYVL